MAPLKPRIAADRLPAPGRLNDLDGFDVGQSRMSLKHRDLIPLVERAAHVDLLVDHRFGAAALALFETLPRLAENPYVFPGAKAGGHLVGLPRIFERVRRRANLNDVRLHDLRHSFASAGAAGGLSLPLIGALLGHKDTKTTQRYAHLADDPLKAAADRISATKPACRPLRCVRGPARPPARRARPIARGPRT